MHDGSSQRPNVVTPAIYVWAIVRERIVSILDDGGPRYRRIDVCPRLQNCTRAIKQMCVLGGVCLSFAL